ncbi:hypothetical protein LINGRAHAP2_LOCUS25923 [Linum grandiflorum]
MLEGNISSPTMCVPYNQGFDIQ